MKIRAGVEMCGIFLLLAWCQQQTPLQQKWKLMAEEEDIVRELELALLSTGHLLEKSSVLLATKGKPSITVAL